MRNVTESMADRAAVLQLWPLSARESAKVGILRGGCPEVLARPQAAALWFSSYLQTYLERDVRAISAVQDLAAFRRFHGLVASRHGQILNRSDLAAPLGLSVPSIGRWIGILEATGQILLVPPYFDNLGKRLIKSPKVCVADAGLACHLLSGRRRELYYFRGQQGLEVDFLVPAKGAGLRLIEARASRTAVPAMACPMERLGAAWQQRSQTQRIVEKLIVHRPRRHAAASTALAPGVKAMPWREFASRLPD
jgi:predicted AAA+ superfamily ATPase